MKHIGFNRLYYLLLALLLLAANGCGTSSSTTASGGTGSLAAKLTFSDSKSAAKSLAAVPAGSDVTTVKMMVTGTSSTGGPIPVVRSSFNALTSNSGTVSGVYPGTVTLTVQAVNASGVVRFEGFALNLVVTANATTDAGTINLSPPLTKAQDVTCIGCHETFLDSTGQNLVAQFKQSGHYMNGDFQATIDGAVVYAGCVGCHGSSHSIPDPSSTGRCFACHIKPASHDATNPIAVVNTNPCSDCHQMHNTAVSQPERYAWGQSAHGDTSSPVWSGELGTSCNRCHTATGFQALLATYSTNRTGATGTSTQPVLETGSVLGCAACHTNASTGALRTLRGMNPNTNYVTDLGWRPVGYALNYGKLQYPDVAGSNLCITCHDSRYNDPGSVTSASTTDVRTHYLGAAATMYVKMGYLNLSTGTSGTTAAYLKSLESSQDIAGGINSTHRILGTPAIIGDTHLDKNGVATFATAQSAGSLAKNGPCVACHFTGDHTLTIDQATITAVCNRCHWTENGHDITTIAQFQLYFLEPQSESFMSAINLAMYLFNTKQSVLELRPESDGSPWIRAFEKGTTTNATAADWTAAATGIYANKTKLLGAVSNLEFLQREQGAFAHARTYSRRLLYDTIDYLDDGVLNMSAGASALAVSLSGDATTNPLLFGVYTKGAKAYNATATATAGTYGITTPATGTSEAMLYLIKWNRSGTTNGTDPVTGAGAWSVPERP